MITIYANWTGNSLCRAPTLDEARAKLGPGYCSPDTVFGTGPADLTALDTSPHDTLGSGRDKFDLLHVARKHFAEVAAEGPGRIA